MIRNDVVAGDSFLTERVVQILKGLKFREYALAGTLAAILCMVALTGVGFSYTSSLKVGEIAKHADAYRGDVQNGEDQRCEAGYGQKAPARQDARGGDDGEKEAEEKGAALCLARLQLREARAANLIALEYNAISADAAWWARLGGMLVTFLGLASVIGIIVALFAASDARRATDASVTMIAQGRRTSRAYLHITSDADMPWPARIRNSGETPAVVSSVLVAYPDSDVAGRDPPVIDWIEDHVLDDVIAPASSVTILLPFIGRDHAHGVVIGIRFRDVYGDTWCSWRHCIGQDQTGALHYGRSGEFPYV
jgi:hypothetical protein